MLRVGPNWMAGPPVFGKSTGAKPYVMTELVNRTRRFQNPKALRKAIWQADWKRTSRSVMAKRGTR
jgi:hypothetical protein